MKLFSNDSKLMKTINAITDGVLLNLCFLLCCIPVVTVGASSSALYTALRRRDLGYPAVKTFFRAFGRCAKRMIPAWTLLLALDVGFGYSIYLSKAYAMEPITVVFAYIALAFSLCGGAVMPAFDSRFDCTFGQLLRNTFLLVVSFPVRSVLVGAFSWFWVILFIFTGFDFITPFFAIWFFFYFSVLWLFNAWILKHPFKLCVQQSGITEEISAEDEDGDIPDDDL